MGFQGNGPGIGGYWHGKGYHRHPWSQVGRIMNYKWKKPKWAQIVTSGQKMASDCQCLCWQGSSMLSTSHLLQLSLSASGCCCSVVHTPLTLLWPHGLQHTRMPCPSPSLGVCSNSCPLSWWCHPTISSSVAPFSSCSLFPGIRVFSSKSALLQVVFPFPGPCPLGFIPSTLLRGLLNSSCWATFSALLLLLFSGCVVSNSLQPHGL